MSSRTISYIKRLGILTLIQLVSNLGYSQTATTSDSIVCSSNTLNARKPFYTFNASQMAPRAILGKSCSSLGFTASNFTSDRLYVKDADQVKIGTFQISSFSTIKQVSSGSMTISVDKNTKQVTIFYYKTDGTFFSKIDTSTIANCVEGDGIYAVLKRSPGTNDYPSSYSNGGLNLENCLVNNIQLYCDSAGDPFTSTSHPCNPPTPPSPLCGNASLDAGEECDLGALNSNDAASSFGCKTNCTKHDGWTCTQTVDEYNAREQETIGFYNTLGTGQSSFQSNNCGEYYAGDATKEAACAQYSEKLRLFKILNATIKVNCSTLKSVRQRPAASGQPEPTEYVINCKPPQV